MEDENIKMILICAVVLMCVGLSYDYFVLVTKIEAAKDVAQILADSWR